MTAAGPGGDPTAAERLSTAGSLLAGLPELCLLAGAVAGLVLGLYLPRERQQLVALLAAVAATVGVVAAGWQASAPARYGFDGAYRMDTMLSAARLVVLPAVLFVLALAVPTLRGHPRQTEFHVLLLLSALGALALAGASDLLVLVVAYLLASIPGYALAGFARDRSGVEAAVKYYLFAALFGVVMLAGVTVWYGLGRATGYAPLAAGLAPVPATAVVVSGVAVAAGPLLKAGAVPVHFWVPDVVQGSRTPVAAFLTTVPKVGALVALFRLAAEVVPDRRWGPLLAVVAAASMTLGNLAAFFQHSPTRLLAYSTVSQVGYLLMAVAAAGATGLAEPTLLYYLAGYAAAHLGAFAVVAALPEHRRLDDYTGLARRRPALAGSLLVCLLGLVGTPPTAVFVGKLGVFTAATDAGMAWLMVLAAVNTVASLFYYLRWIAPAFRPAGDPAGGAASGGTHAGAGSSSPAAVDTGREEPTARRLAYLAAAVTVALGAAGGPVLAVLT